MIYAVSLDQRQIKLSRVKLISIKHIPHHLEQYSHSLKPNISPENWWLGDYYPFWSPILMPCSLAAKWLTASVFSTITSSSKRVPKFSWQGGDDISQTYESGSQIQWFCPTFGRYPVFPKPPQRNSETETVGEGSGVSSKGGWDLRQMHAEANRKFLKEKQNGD